MGSKPRSERLKDPAKGPYPAGIGEQEAGPLRAWCVYLLECRGGVMYAGITNDLEGRFKAHQAGRGARFTRANPPLRILAHQTFENRSAASKVEWALKKLPKAKKLTFLAIPNHQQP